MSLEFARLDTSKPGDSHAVVMRKRNGKRKRKRMARGRAAGTDVRAPGESASWASAMLPGAAGCFASVRRSQSDGGVRNDCPRILALICIHDIVPVIDAQNLLPIEPYLNQCLVLLRKPESINFLVLPHEVGPLDPEGEFFRGMALYPYDGVVLYVDPKLTFKQVFVFPLGHRLGDEATIWANLLFTQQIQKIIVTGNGAVMVLFSGCRLDLAINQRIQGHMSDQSRARLGSDCKGL